MLLIYTCIYPIPSKTVFLVVNSFKMLFYFFVEYVKVVSMSGRLKSSSRQASQLMFHFPIQALGKKIRPLYCIFSYRIFMCSYIIYMRVFKAL